jgi:hypothetical protein
MVAVLDRHHPVAPAGKLARQRNGKRRLPRILAADH